MAWIGLYRPEEHEVASLASEFQLHELAVEDAIVAHQRPKLERYGDTLLRRAPPGPLPRRRSRRSSSARSTSSSAPTSCSPFATARRPTSARSGGAWRASPNCCDVGPEAVLYAILDRVVDGYYPVVAGVGNDIDEIEIEVFSGDPKVSRRIYELSREVTEFQRATRPLIEVMTALSAGFAKYGIDEELQRYLRDVEDHLTQVCRAGRGVPSAAPRHAHRQRHPRRPAAERGDEEPGRRPATSRTRRSRRSRPGPPSSSPPRSSARSTA